MLLIRKLPFRGHRKPVTPPAPGPAPLALVEVLYPIDPVGAIRINFDRMIDISGLDGTQIIVKDGLDLGFIMQATGPAELSIRGRCCCFSWGSRIIRNR